MQYYLCTLALVFGFNLSVRAAPTIRVPVLLEGWTFEGNKRSVFLVRDVADRLAERGVNLPEHVLINKPQDQKKFSRYGFQIADAGIGMPGVDSALSLVNNRIMSDYEVKGRAKICYLPRRGISLRENAETAFALYESLDEVLTEDYVVIGLRYFDEARFDDEDGGGEFPTSVLNEKYAPTKLEPGAVQIIATLDRFGRTVFEEILTPCK